MDVTAELDRLWQLPRAEKAATGLLGWEMLLADGASFVSQYREIFIAEAYSFDHPGAPTIIDGGANIGMASIWWLARWPDARIVAFEPDPMIFALLSHNLRYQPSGNIELRRAALSTPELGAVFEADGADGGRIISATDAEREVISVPTQSLADLIRNLEHVDLLKLDIEGVECEVLEECAGELHRVDRIFVEYHSFRGSSQRLPEMLALLRDAGFRIYVESPLTFVRPFHVMAGVEGADLQLNIWAYRV